MILTILILAVVAYYYEIKELKPLAITGLITYLAVYILERRFPHFQLLGIGVLLLLIAIFLWLKFKSYKKMEEGLTAMLATLKSGKEDWQQEMIDYLILGTGISDDKYFDNQARIHLDQSMELLLEHFRLGWEDLAEYQTLRTWDWERAETLVDETNHFYFRYLFDQLRFVNLFTALKKISYTKHQLRNYMVLHIKEKVDKNIIVWPEQASYNLSQEDVYLLHIIGDGVIFGKIRNDYIYQTAKLLEAERIPFNRIKAIKIKEEKLTVSREGFKDIVFKVYEPGHTYYETAQALQSLWNMSEKERGNEDVF